MFGILSKQRAQPKTAHDPDDDDDIQTDSQKVKRNNPIQKVNT